MIKWYKILRLKALYKGKKIAFYGAGIYARKLLEKSYFSGLNILGCIDRDYSKKGTKIAGYEVFFLDDIEILKPDVLILTIQNPEVTLPSLLSYLNDKNMEIKIETISGFDVPALLKDMFMWAICSFLALIVPKKKNSVIFIGKTGRHFLDNTKHLYNHLVRAGIKGVEYSFLTEDKRTFDLLEVKNLPVCFYPELKTVWKLLRSQVIVMDSATWVENNKCHLAFGAKKIQLWHGVGFKLIRLLEPRYKEVMVLKSRGTFFKRLKYRLKCEFPTYDVINSTSEFYTENVFKPAFDHKAIFEGGYPRNDALFREADELDLIETDIESYNKILEYKKQGYKTVLYAPTFRDNRNDPVIDETINLEEWSRFGEKNKIAFVLKFHPTPNVNYTKFKNLKNIIVYDSAKDIYPALRNIDLLVTDYSSIYMDYLLTDRPVLFFPYDYKDYVLKDRGIQFDYNWITPGVKCYNQDELFKEIQNILINTIDDCREKRQEIKSMAFKDPDGNSCERIWDCINDRMV